MNGIVTANASSRRKFMISSGLASSSRIKPGTEAPIVTESKFEITARKMILGTVDDLNQLTANFTGELKTNMLPIADKIDPIRQNMGLSIYIRVLIQTPEITKIAPIKKPTLMPYLSRIQFTGNEKMG